jgi:hypothetical protein
VNNCTFWISRKIYNGSSRKVAPRNNPVGIFVSYGLDYYITDCIFDYFGSSTPNQTFPSYAIIANDNYFFGTGFINKNFIRKVDIGIQSQNEKGSTFIRCNDFGSGNSLSNTFNFDITVPTGYLKQHDGCLPFVNSSIGVSSVPGNTFSTSTSSNHNIKITSSVFPPNSSTFRYNYYSLTRHLPHDITPNVTVNLCGSTSNPHATGCDGIILNGNFNYNYEVYKTSKSSVDSLISTYSDSVDIEMGSYFENLFLNLMVNSITTQDQYDSAIVLLTQDISALSKYQLLRLYINSEEFDSAQSVIDNNFSFNDETDRLKSLFNILIPIYSNYSFTKLDSIRTVIDSIAADSGLAGKRAKYLINYIDETNAIIGGSDDFEVFYNDSILPVDPIDTNAAVSNLYIIDAYPNPFTTIIYSDFTNNSGTAGQYKMKLFDSYATLIDQTQDAIDDTQTRTLHLDTSSVDPGFYYLQFTDDNNVILGYRIIYKAP